jgi:hypothetical protein
MGSGIKTKHTAYVVTPASAPDKPIAVPETEGPFFATDDTQSADFDSSLVGPTTANTWIHNGFGPGGAQAFIGAGVEDPQLAKEFIDAGLGPEEAEDWVDAGLGPAQASQWGGVGFTADEAKTHIGSGLSPVEAIAGSAEVFTASSKPVLDDLDAEAAMEASAFEPSEPAVEAPTYEDVAPATTLPDAGKVSEAAWHEAVTPIPDEVAVGDPRGVPLLIGGADLEGGSATIIAYQDTKAGGSAHEVLFCTVTEEAEEKLLYALAPVQEQKLIPVENPVEFTGMHELDTQHNIFDDAKTAAISVNHHMKVGDEIPEHTVDRIKKLTDFCVNNADSEDSAVAAMVAHYTPFVEAMEAMVKPGVEIGDYASSKIANVTPFETTYTKIETTWIPDPDQGMSHEDKLAANSRQASRVAPTVKDGVVVWDGKHRENGKGKEYVIDLPGGYTAVYHPYEYEGQSKSSDHYSLRGQLEIQCPGGEGHAKELVDVLGSLNIVNRPMNGAEAEWTYLQRNIEAQGLGSNPTVGKAHSASAHLEDQVAQELMYKHASEAKGLLDDEAGLQALAHRLTLEAEASALPLRVRMVRDAVAKATGFGTGKELAEHDSYRPMPRQSGGWMVFDRFDVARDESKLGKAWGSKCLHARLTGGSVLDIFRNGGILASTERRALMGIKASTMSPEADKVSGGATSTFVRVGAKKTGAWGSNHIVWDQPLRLVARSDWYAYNGDHFGALNPHSHHSTSGKTTDPSTAASFSAGNNEMMFLNGLDLLGSDAPTRVYCSSASERDQVRKLLKGKGITELGGRLVDDVILAA